MWKIDPSYIAGHAATLAVLQNVKQIELSYNPEIPFVGSLAKLICGIAALASTLFGQVVWRDLKLTLAPHASTCP